MIQNIFINDLMLKNLLLEKILAKLDSKGSAMVSNNDDYNDMDLGVIDNDEDLNNMEEKLVNDKPYRNAVV